MPNSVAIEIVHSSAQQKRFIRFAWDHYKGDPNWIPPLRSEIKKLLNYKPHPFYFL